MSVQTGCAEVSKYIFDRQVGQPIIILGLNILIGQTFYGPTPSTDDTLLKIKVLHDVIE